ncbi:hypothetical protein MCANUFG4_02166 [Mycoplasmopsis canis UFG4]|uniref:Uncharacterized protein n=2 Tax=Mycoplasmopsis canis TaxID=29555 RepID=I1A5S9_9BACT|nr:hypothetical protein [Mycoplasmopsis canis]EIE41850.1 hypothetical protein MCANUFG4_02166 [Mycoplasmopsis canis UFG4]
METIKNFFTFKNIRNVFILVFSMIGAFIVAIILGYKLNTPFRPAFFNYKSYISKLNHDTINEKFEFKTFNEVDEFTIALNNNKAIAGIGSDFQVIDLIKRGFIQKINFEKLLNINKKIESKDQLKEILKNIYTPTVFHHLESYDPELLTDSQGNKFDEPKHLWEYFVPYFHQDGVVAINPLKTTKKVEKEFNSIFSENYEELKKTTKLTNFNEKVKELSLFNILNTISKNGYQKLLITDAVRVNMLYGSPYQIKNNEIHSNYGEITTEENYKVLVDSFVDLISKSTGNPIESDIFSFSGDGQEVLRTLLDATRKDVNAAIMFNGDALDAYYSEDNGLNIKNKNGEIIPIPDGTIEAYKFSENIIFVDGLVVANNITNNSEDVLYETLRNSIYANFAEAYKRGGSTQFLRNVYDEYLTVAFRDKFLDYFSSKQHYSETELLEFKKELIDIYASTLNKELDDNDLLKFNNFVADKFQNDENIKNVLEKIFEYDESKMTKEELISQIAFKLSHIDFDDESFIEILEKKYQNLENFAFVNYTPSNIAEYDLVKRNYFINDDNTYDKKAIEIFEVKDQPGKIEHKRLSGVSEKIQSLLNTYYYLKIKH